MKNRRKAREQALQLFYQWEAQEFLPIETHESLPALDQGALRQAIRSFVFDYGASESEEAFLHSLIFGTLENLVSIDRALQSISSKWKVGRMNRVDRNILRLATFELLFQNQPGTKVIINEAVEIGKKYGGENSGAFINGILDAVANQKKS